MAQVDPGDDTIQRYVVRHYRFDPERNERRHVVVAAYDNEHEFGEHVQRLTTDLVRQRAAGEVLDAQEHVSGVVLEPHHRELNQNGRLLRRAAEHGSVPRDLVRIPLPRHVSLFESEQSAPPVSIPAPRQSPDASPRPASPPGTPARSSWWRRLAGRAK